MQIQFENQYIKSFQQFSVQTSRVQIGMEAVVPDVNDDIGQIVSVQSSVFLKSKEAFSKRICISGEVQSVLIYITEEDNQISSVKLSKTFDLEYEENAFDPDTRSQIRLKILNTEARIINPRKVSVFVELEGELKAFRTDSILVKTSLDDDPPEGLHIKRDGTKAFFNALVTEKPFALSEQFSFDSNQPEPIRLLSQRVFINCAEPQKVGCRLILRGNIEVQVWYLTDNYVYPLEARFNEPFSQILDVNDAAFEFGRTSFEVTSSYFDLIDTISGGKAMEMELHILAQFTGYCAETIEYISDSYSNKTPAELIFEERALIGNMRAFSEVINSTETVPFVDDCAELCTVFTQTPQTKYMDDTLCITIPLEILYITRAGTLANIKRSLTLSKSINKPTDQFLQAVIRDLDLRQNENEAEARISIELFWENSEEINFRMISSLILDTETTYDIDSYPSLTLVRVDEESLWDLAKQYHSSIKGIKEMNENAGSPQGKILLIPKQI